MMKNLPAMQKTQVRSLDQEWLPTPVLLPGEFYGQENLVGYTVHGVAKNRIQLSWVIFHCIHAIEHNLSNITIIKVYAQATNAKEAEVEWVYEDLQDLLELTPKKECPFHHRGLEWKSSKSSVNLSNRQIWPWNTKWSREKANQVLPREHTG